MPEAHRVEYYVTPEMTEPAVRAALASRGMAVPPASVFRNIGRALGLLFLTGVTYVNWTIHGFDLVFFIGPGVVLFFTAAYVAERWYLHQLRTAFRESVTQLEGVPVVWTFREDGITLQSALGAREIPWNTVRDLYNGHGFWLLAEASGKALAIPVESLRPPAERFLIDRARVAGATVRPPTDTIEDDYDDLALGRPRTR